MVEHYPHAPFIFSSAGQRDMWADEYATCHACGGVNEPRKYQGPWTKRIYPGNKKIIFQKNGFMPVCPKCTFKLREEKAKATLARELVRAHRAALPARHKCEPGHHYCSKCKLNKPFEQFSTRGKGKGLAGICKECNRAHVNEWRKAKEQPARRLPALHKGAFIGVVRFPQAVGEVVRFSYANGYVDLFPDGSETWTRREPAG